MATILAVVSPRAQLQVKTQAVSPRMQQSAKTATPQRTLRPANAPPEGAKVKRQLAMNLNKGGPVVNNRRNARERNRVKQVNQGFAVLRAHLPMAQKSKKISKVDTLRGAIDYIHGLTELLSTSECGSVRSSSSETLGSPPFDTAGDPAHGPAQAPETGYPGSAFLPPGYTTAATFPTEHGSYGSYGGALSGEEPPSYGETLRQRQLVRQLQQQQQQQRGPQEDLINALRWWHPPAPRQ